MGILQARMLEWVAMPFSRGSSQPSGGGHVNPLQYSYLENPHGQRSLVGYSPWGHKELDTTEQFSLTHSLQYYEDSLLHWSESSFGFSITSYRKTQTFWPTQYCMQQEKGELPKQSD